MLKKVLSASLVIGLSMATSGCSSNDNKYIGDYNCIQSITGTEFKYNLTVKDDYTSELSMDTISNKGTWKAITEEESGGDEGDMLEIELDNTYVLIMKNNKYIFVEKGTRNYINCIKN